MLCRQAGRKPTDDEAQGMAKAMETALLCYNWLSTEAHRANLRLWKIVPKFHLITHCAYDQAKVTNPRWVHCYKDEDMVGKVKKIVLACHGKTAGNRVLDRYRVFFGIRWYEELASARGVSLPLAGAKRPREDDEDA